MGLVDSCALGLWGSLVLEDICLLFGWIPKSCIVYGGDVEVLSDSFDPGGNALLTDAAVGGYE